MKLQIQNNSFPLFSRGFCDDRSPLPSFLKVSSMAFPKSFIGNTLFCHSILSFCRSRESGNPEGSNTGSPIRSEMTREGSEMAKGCKRMNKIYYGEFKCD